MIRIFIQPSLLEYRREWALLEAEACYLMAQLTREAARNPHVASSVLPNVAEALDRAVTGLETVDVMVLVESMTIDGFAGSERHRLRHVRFALAAVGELVERG